MLVTDMSHLSAITKQHDISYYLAKIKRMQDIIAMTVTRHQGTVIKSVAENSLAIFNWADALHCIIEINHTIKLDNNSTPKRC